MENGIIADCVGAVSRTSTSFEDLTVHLDYLVVDNTPFDIIIGRPTLKALKALMDFYTYSVIIRANRK